MPKSPLEEMGHPYYFIANNAADAGFSTPPNPLGQSLRTCVRSLGGMQKEVLVVSAMTGTAWRLVCDEGPHLGGDNQAPNPLTYLSAGMIASYMNEITALAEQRTFALSNLELTLDNLYYREGDFRKGSMISGALPPELEVRCDTDCDDQMLNRLIFEAVSASPLNGLASGVHPSLFTLVHNGQVLTPEQVTPLGVMPFSDPCDHFVDLRWAPASDVKSPLINLEVDEETVRKEIEKNPPVSPKLDGDKILLHMHTSCVLHEDGVKEILKKTYTPAAPVWSFLSDEAPGFGGQGRAPDAATLISAGIALCFVTQMGRFAQMAKLPMFGCRIIQDTHFSPGGASGKTGKVGTAQPVETHVFLDTEVGDDDAQQILGVGERTCFLHAFCRTDVKPKVRLIRSSQAA